MRHFLRVSHTLAFLLASVLTCAAQVPNHSSPVGIGPGSGWRHVGPCAVGSLPIGQGASADPICSKVILTQPATTATLTIANNKTLTVNNSLTFTGTDGATYAFQAAGTVVNRDSTDTLTNKTLVAPALGAATATSINGITITPAAGTLTLNNNTLAVAGAGVSFIIGGTAGTLGFQGTDTYVGRATTDTLTNKTFDTAGTGNVFKINGTGITAVTGTGAVVLADSPVHTTQITTPRIIGGSGTGSTLTHDSTSGAGSTDSQLFRTGSQVTRMSIINSGFIGIGAQVPQTQLDVSSHPSSASTPAITGAGALLRIHNADATPTGLQMDSIGAITGYHARRANGTFASLTGLVANDIIFSFRGYGYTNAGAYTTSSRAKFEFISTETWTATANGSAIQFFTTPNGTAAFATVGQFSQAGGFSVATTSDPGLGMIYTNSASFMIRTKTSYTNGAAANTGTLTNAPAVGNPTKWIAIDDNGTTRQIPAW